MQEGRPSQTAEIVAFMRATERVRAEADRVLDDPYATWFLTPLSKTRLAAMQFVTRKNGAPLLFPLLTTYIVTRHRYMDDVVTRALADGAEQFIVLGAGYDMRSFRFAEQLAGRPVFEVDHPATAGRKGAIVDKHADERPANLDLRRVTIDFATESLPERLAANGFVAGRKTVVTWEGVSMYLPRAAVKATLRTLADLLGKGSTLTMDFWLPTDSPTLKGTFHRVSGAFLWALGEPVTFGVHPEDVAGLLSREGWTLTDTATADVLEQRYIRDGRHVYPHNFVVTAVTA
jgi:methyltransferase (TIGR00027 family)